MLPYLFLLVVVFWFAIANMQPSLISHKFHANFSWLFIFLLLIIFIGFRQEVGGDWESYVRFVDEMSGEPVTVINLFNDPAYSFLNWVGSNFFGGLYLVNIICAFIFCYGLSKFCLSQPRPWLALMVSLPYLIIVVAMGYNRQGVAIGIVLIAIVSLQRGNFFYFFINILLAALFHKSALILLPFAIFVSTPYKLFKILSIVILIPILLLIYLQEQSDYLIRGYIQPEYESSGAFIRIIMNAIPAFFLIILEKRFKLSSSSKRFWVWMAWLALAFIPVLMISPSSTFIDRLALYWIPLQLFVYSRLPDVLGSHGRRNPFLVIIISIYSILIGLVWLIFADTANEWLPYRFYPWEQLWN